MSFRWLVYGANGYTGKIIAERAAARGLRPVLAGRREDAIRPLAEKLKLDYRIFDLSDLASTDRALEGIAAVLHCAGPFSATSKRMVDACLRSKVHYLDITGEIFVFEALHARSREAVEAGITLLPGVGFDVVPSDCLAASLVKSLPEAIELEMAFAAQGGALSKGTLKTMVEHWEKGGAIRRDGKIVSVRQAHISKEVRFSDKTRSVAAIPWGDVATAFYSTGIPNITIYVASSALMPVISRAMTLLNPLIGNRSVKRFLQNQIEKRVKGPDEVMHKEGSVKLWGKVTSRGGLSKEAWLDVPESYSLTADTAIVSAERAAQGKTKPGYFTPSQAFGSDFITEFPGTRLTML